MVQSTLMNEAASDRVVIMGAEAIILLEGVPFALRVQVVALSKKESQGFPSAKAIDEDSARWLIERTDRERAGFLLTVYGRDGKDPRITILSRLSPSCHSSRSPPPSPRFFRKKTGLTDEKSMGALK